MKIIWDIVVVVYAYCTDFIISLANLTSTSYYEINAFIFCILWPALTLVLIGWCLVLKVKIYNFRKANAK